MCLDEREEKGQERERFALLRWKGRLADLSGEWRRRLFAYFAAVSAALVFAQMGIAVIPLIGAGSFDFVGSGYFYVVGLCAPISLAALLLGPKGGSLTGVASAAALSLQMLIAPRDSAAYITFSIWGYFLIFSLFGLLQGLLFACVFRRCSTRRSQAWGVVAVCALMSMFFCGALYLCTSLEILRRYASICTAAYGLDASGSSQLLNRVVSSHLRSIGDPRFQMLCNFALMLLPCGLASQVWRRLGPNPDERPLRRTFSVCLAAVVLLSYLGAVACVIVTLCHREYDLDEVRQNSVADEIVHLMETVSHPNGFEDPELRYELFPVVSNGNLINEFTEIIAEGTGTKARILHVNEEMDGGIGTSLDEALGPECLLAVRESMRTGRVVPATFANSFESCYFDEVAGLSTASPFLLLAREVSVDVGNGGPEPFVIILACPYDPFFSRIADVVNWSSWSTFVMMLLLYLVVVYLLRATIAKPIERMGEELRDIYEGDLDVLVDAHGSKEFVALSSGINSTVDSLKGYIDEAVRRGEEELATARAIQASALPSTFPPFPEIDDFDLYASMNTAREVGGDFYDFFLTGAGTVAFLIADVSGKGIPGALFMMRSKAELKNALLSRDGLGEAVAVANENLCEGNDNDMFVTGWVAELNYKSGTINFVSAGHNPPLLRHDGVWRWLDKRGGPVMGMIEGVSYQSHELTLEPGDQILLYTDGVNEAFNVEREQFGYERFEAFASAHADLGPRELVEALQKEVSAWSEGTVQSDDITVLVLEYHPKL